MKKLGSLGVFTLVLTAATSAALADETTQARSALAPSKLVPVADEADGAGIKSPAMVAVGSVIGSVGVAQGVLGGILVATGNSDGCVEPGCVNDAGMFGSFGVFIGTMLLVDSGIKLAVAIPLIAVGASDHPEGAPGAPPPVALHLEVGPTFTGLGGTF